jgi:hypothetical protein
MGSDPASCQAIIVGSDPAFVSYDTPVHRFSDTHILRPSTFRLTLRPFCRIILKLLDERGLMEKKSVIVVSGLPRSGTSMMMKMLEAGGVSVLVDNIRKADEDNPKGYYEFERVKQIQTDKEWLEDAHGKVVKMVSALLKNLPDGYLYKVIFMRRKMEEILASQKKMLERQGKPTDDVSDERLAKLYEQHLKEMEAWFGTKSNFDILYVSYNDVLRNPAKNARAVNEFLGHSLNVENMVRVVDKLLYRQRR